MGCGRYICFIITISVFSSLISKEWINPGKCDVRTIYFQGIFASQAQIAKYTGDSGFVATTGEYVKCIDAPEIMYQPYVGKELDEVNFKRLYHEDNKIRWMISSLGRLCFPSSIIQEIVSLSKACKWGIITEPHLSIGDETVGSFSICWKKCDLGQKGDVAEHKQKYEMCLNDNPRADLILYGASRGAATTFNAVALNKYDTSRLKLVVLESCYDSIPLLLKTWYPKAFSHSMTNIMAQHLFSLFTGYHIKGAAPIDMIDLFPEGLPVVFVSSRADKTIPLVRVEHLAHELAQRQKNPVYFLTLEHSSHPTYAIHNEEDKHFYLHFMHALYKQLNLPYIQEYAELGEKQNLVDQFRIN